jgi:hypothetical protein
MNDAGGGWQTRAALKAERYRSKGGGRDQIRGVWLARQTDQHGRNGYENRPDPARHVRGASAVRRGKSAAGSRTRCKPANSFSNCADLQKTAGTKGHPGAD